ncbi:hypothetical protein B1T48_06960 [Mycobacterium persicum]|nr:hypothetical protein B1T48_06960 [Mycobacterium persicum]
MNDTSETGTNETPEAVAPAPPKVTPRSDTPKVFKAAAWVAVVAGTLFIVAGIFFAGFGFAVYTKDASSPHYRQREYPAMVMEIPNAGHGGHGAPNHAPSSVAPSPAPAR